MRPSCFPYHTLIETFRSWGEDPGLPACLSGRRPGGLAHFVRLVLELKKLEVYERTGGFDSGLATGHKALSEARAAGLPLGQAQALLGLSGNFAGKSDYLRMKDVNEQALELFVAYGNRQGQANALNNLGFVSRNRGGDIESALSYYGQALRSFEAIGDQAQIAVCLNNLSHVYLVEGDYDQALKSLGRALDLTERIGDLRNQGICLSTIAMIQRRQGQASLALASLERALSTFQSVGDRYGQAAALSNIGLYEAGLGNYPKALRCYQEALQLAAFLGDRTGMAFILSNFGSAHEALGDSEAAITCQERALAIRRETGERRRLILSLVSVARASLSLGDLAKARKEQDEAQALVQEQAIDKDLHSFVVQSAASLALEAGELEAAAREIESGLLLAEALSSKRHRAGLLFLRARLKENLSDWPGSEKDFTESVNLFGSLGEKAEIARVSYHFGKALLAHGVQEKGDWYLAEAKRLWEDIGAKGWLAKVKDSS